VTPTERLLAGVVWRCTLCGGAATCDCWAKRKERALAYIASVAERCACGAPGAEAAACGCSPPCDCHADEETAAERGAAMFAPAGPR
jgi:hypothetical protein